MLRASSSTAVASHASNVVPHCAREDTPSTLTQVSFFTVLGFVTSIMLKITGVMCVCVYIYMYNRFVFCNNSI